MAAIWWTSSNWFSIMKIVILTSKFFSSWRPNWQKSVLVRVMISLRTGKKPLSEPLMIRFIGAYLGYGRAIFSRTFSRRILTLFEQLLTNTASSLYLIDNYFSPSLPQCYYQIVRIQCWCSKSVSATVNRWSKEMFFFLLPMHCQTPRNRISFSYLWLAVLTSGSNTKITHMNFSNVIRKLKIWAQYTPYTNPKVKTH